MAIGNVPVPKMKAPVFKTVQFKAPKINTSVKVPKTAITAKAARPATIKQKPLQ